MTTIAALFTRPQSCSTTFRGTDGAVSVGVQCLSGTLTDDNNCYPSPMPTACPFNWRVVTTQNSRTTCCPNEYDLHTTNHPVRCYSTAGGEQLSAFICDPGSAQTEALLQYPIKPGVWASVIAYVGTTTLPSATSTANEPSASTTTPTSPTTLMSPTTPTSSPPTIPTKSHLTAGTIAGTVIGSIAAIALILASIAILKKRHRRSKSTSEHTPNTYDNTKSEMYIFSPPVQPDPIEVDSHNTTARANPIELDGHNTTARANYK